ncbi:MAG: MarR family transcriptional regulator [Acidimicrobiia bacterium]|nr:MarR family transcriptional regulator [Acidimicrobiia bacterium]
MEHLDHSLQEKHGIPLTDYEILVFLSESEEHQLRMSEIANHVLVSRSRLTYRVDRLVEQGFVVRTEAPDDRRGLFAELTPRGLDVLSEAAKTHVADVRSHLMDHISKGDLPAFSRTWKSIAEFTT